MKEKKRKKLYRGKTVRQWLNTIRSGGGTAFIRTEVPEILDEDPNASVYASIDIADCSRIVSLDFHVCQYEGSDETEAAAIQKLDILMMELGQFRAELSKALEAVKKSKANAAKAAKREKK